MTPNTYKPDRNQLLEHELNAAIARGAGQYVIIAPGPDSNAYRDRQKDLRIFEVGHLAEQQTLASALDRAGFQAGEISFFSWLGVSPYSSARDTLATLAFIGSLPAGSGVVFDYAACRSSLDPVEETAMDALASRFEDQDGSTRMFLNVRTLDQLLRSVGFHEVEDLGPARASGIAHLLRARI